MIINKQLKEKLDLLDEDQLNKPVTILNLENETLSTIDDVLEVGSFATKLRHDLEYSLSIDHTLMVLGISYKY